MKKLIASFLALLFLSGCGTDDPANSIRVGTIAGPESELAEVAAQQAKQQFNLNVKIVEFSDYGIPNVALAEGDIDLNVFQHLPYLEQTNNARGYSLVEVGKTFSFPMGLYSQKIKNIKELTKKSKVAVPNDPTNEARALLLLQKADLIKVDPKKGNRISVQDVIENKLELSIIPIKASQLARVLPDVALAAINSTYAIPAGLSPKKDALFLESKDSPYVNIIVARKQQENTDRVKQFVAAYQSEPVIEKAKQLFGENAIAAW